MPTTIQLMQLNELERYPLPNGGYLEKRIHRTESSEITVLNVHNGLMTLSIVPERGMEIGEIYMDNQLVSWQRASSCLKHPDEVDLEAREGTGWMDGFYSAVAVIGPELFGTPGEGYTLHGTGSYSSARHESIFIQYDEQGILIQGIVPCKGYGKELLFEKEIRLTLAWHTSFLFREETTYNRSSTEQVLDDGYHIQLSGPYLHEGGRYILPTEKRHMLLRDRAVPEEDPFHIPALQEGPQPMRCYQYVPNPVRGLEQIDDIAAEINRFEQQCPLTAEMLVNHGRSGAGVVIRPLHMFPRSLIAKETKDSFMYALEPCRTRPNRMSQKITDGESFVLAPGAHARTECLIGFINQVSTIQALEALIVRASIS